MRRLEAVTAAAAIAALSSIGFAQGVITDGDARFEVNNFSFVSGSMDFEPDSAGLADDVLHQNWWWYRVNGVDGREFELPWFPGSQSYLGNTATLGWSGLGGGAFDATLDIQLFDGAAPEQATLVQQMTVTNLTAAPLSISLFAYSDVDVFGLGNDTATLWADNIIRVADAGRTVDVQGVNADAFQVTGWESLRTLLNDDTISNLDDSGLSFGPGDYTGAFQWDLLIGPGGSGSVTDILSVNVIPAPGALALLGIAAFILRVRRPRA